MLELGRTDGGFPTGHQYNDPHRLIDSMTHERGDGGLSGNRSFLTFDVVL